ncbi:Altered inheritance of mitochondria protein 6 [Paraconiothyrium brasiliense]|uniref:Altered inheritance of mitochondria protein 6 n=1 Tax=Paraconiothyrium brasiliense TaxID=300254 RepID=A0ABR3RPW4_9PLEO
MAGTVGYGRSWTNAISGIVHISNVLMGLVNLIRDDAITYSHDFLPLDRYQKGDYTGLTQNVKPIHCHSHNDYWRRVPLFEALRWGCTGVEADVWFYPERSNDLFVGHSTRDLTNEHTFRSMYVDHLMRIVDQQNTPNTQFQTTSTGVKNGVFEMDPTQTLVLLVDFKNDGHALYPVVSEQLEPLRKKGYLSHYDGKTLIPGPITIVATGNAPFDLITRNTTHRDIFFDAPLSALSPLSSQTTNREVKRAGGQGTVGTTPLSTFDLTNSYYASVDFKKAIGWCWFGRLTSTQRELIRTQIRAAKERGLKSRYWGAPKWPVGVRNMVWRVLVEEGVDYLNGDDLREMTKGDWGAKVHGS